MSKQLSHEEMFKKVGNILHFEDNPYHIIHSCLIVYKPVSMRSITPLAKLFSKTAVMAIPSQANARATIIMGEEADIKLMREDVRFKALCKEAWKQHIHERTGLGGYENLPENIRNWFETGHVGSSSLTLLNVSLGRKYGFYESDDHTHDSPLDSQDFERCALLVKAVPELKDHLPKMAGISPLWKFAVEHWDHYNAQLDKVARQELTPKDVYDEYKAAKPQSSSLRM